MKMHVVKQMFKKTIGFCKYTVFWLLVQPNFFSTTGIANHYFLEKKN